MTSSLSRILLALAAVPLLAGCESSATSYTIEGSQHALILMREQKWLWDDTVEQAVVASRLPECQRRVTIHPGAAEMEEMQVYEAGDRLWALHQGNRWYLASTERCLVQDWDNAEGRPPGPLVGRFVLRDGSPVFVREDAPAER